MVTSSSKRALVPRDVDAPAPIPADPAYTPATPPGIVVTETPGEVGTGTGMPPRPQPWTGWPAEWPTPYWSGNARLEELTDVAWSCLDKNSAIVAAMPPYLVGAATSLDTAWLTNPDPLVYNGWWDFMRQAVWEFIGLGEVIIVAGAYYRSGKPATFRTVPPYLVDIELDGGTRRYHIGRADVTADVLHIRYHATTQDPHGIGPLTVGRGRLIAANLLGRYVTNLMSAGGVPTTALVHPGELTAAQIADLQNQWVAARVSSMGLPAVLSGGITYQSTAISPHDLALTELTQMTEARLCVLLGVPPHMMALPSGGDSLTYTSPAQTTSWHWRAFLRPIVRPIAEAISNWALPAGTSFEFNRDDYVQPEPTERAAYYATMTGIGAMTLEEVRMRERLDAATPSPVESPNAGVLQ